MSLSLEQLGIGKTTSGYKPVASAPVPKAAVPKAVPQPTGVSKAFATAQNVGGFLGEVNKFYDKMPVVGQIKRTAQAGLGGLLKPIGDALSVPINILGGFAQGTRAEAERQAPIIKADKSQFIPGVAKSLFAGVKNIPSGVQNKVFPSATIERSLEQDLNVKNPYVKAGVGLAADLTTDPLNYINPVALATKLGKFAKVPELATKLYQDSSLVRKVVDKGNDAVNAFAYGRGVPKPFMNAYENVTGRGVQKSIDVSSKVARPLIETVDGVKLSAQEQKIIGDVLDNLEVQKKGRLSAKEIEKAVKLLKEEILQTNENLVAAKYGYKPGVKIAGLLPEGRVNSTPLNTDKLQGFSLPTRLQTSSAVKYQKGLDKVKELERGAIEAGLKAPGITAEEARLMKKYRPLAESTAGKFEKLAKQQIKLGVNPKIFDKYLGTYTGKRTYLSKMGEKVPVSQYATPKQLRLNMSQYQKRADIPTEVREAMGQVKQPAYGAATAAYNESQNIQKLKFYKTVAKRYAGRAGEGMVQLPKDQKLGVLSGAFLPKNIASYVNSVSSPEKASPLIKFFKEGKTILSPKQLIRNTVASQVQAMMNPSGRADSIRRLPEAIRELRSKGKYYKEAKDAGIIGKTFAHTELAQYLPDGVVSETSKFLGSQKAGKVYENIKKPGAAIQNANEDMVKLQVFINERKAGATIAKAAKMAEETGFDYGKVTPFVNKLRKGGKFNIGNQELPFSVPFITYGLKAGELTAKTLAKKPTRIANLRKVEQAVERTSEGQNIDERNMPDYQKDSVRLPVKDKKGNNYRLNTKYLYPWGSMADFGSLYLPAGQSPDPVFGEIVSQGLNKDIFTGKDIQTKPGFVKGVLGQRGRHVAETLLPTPFRSGMKIYDAATKAPRYSTSPSVGEAVVQELGLPAFKYDPRLGAKFSQYDRSSKISKMKSEMKKELQEATGNPQKQAQIRQDYLKEMRKIVSGQ